MNAQEALEAIGAAFAEIHGQDPKRLYSVAEVKQIVYPLINCIPVVDAEPKPECVCYSTRSSRCAAHEDES